MDYLRGWQDYTTRRFFNSKIGNFTISEHVYYLMWNLIGTMGMISSERTDMTYEPYRGKLFDREMTNIMQSTGR